MVDANQRRAWVRGSATLKDIAKRVGVSESAVSTVINGARSHTRVSAHTRQKVEEAALELGYRPNAVARALISGRTNRIGVYGSKPILPVDPFWSSVLSGLFRTGRALEYDIVLHTSTGSPERMIEMVSDRTVDGLIVLAQGDSQIVGMLEERHIPAVAIVDRIGDLPSVCVDDEMGGSLLAEHLWQRGHRSVLALESSAYVSAAMKDRLDGFLRRANALGVSVTCVDFPWEEHRPLTDESLRLLKRTQDRATAVVAHNDVTATRTVSQLRELGLLVPEDVAVTGYDGFEFHVRQELPLTTIFADWAEVASQGIQVLESLIKGERVESLTKIPVHLRIGASA